MHARSRLAIGRLRDRGRNRMSVASGALSYTERPSHLFAGHGTDQGLESAPREWKGVHRSGRAHGPEGRGMRDGRSVLAGLSGAFRPILAIGLGMLAVQLHAAAAPDWPARPVRVVAPFAPGGSADRLRRMVAERLSVRFNQNFGVDNRAGAGGTGGSELVAQGSPEGCALLLSRIASHAIGPAMATVAFDPVTSFTHIALFGGPPIVVVVHPGVDAKNLNEFVALSKSAPQGISYGSPGPGTNGHLVAELFRMR